MVNSEIEKKTKKINILLIIIPILIVVLAVLGIIVYPKISMKLRDGKWTLEDGFYVYYKNDEKLINQKIATGGKYYIVDELGHRVENFVEYDKDGKTVIAYYEDGNTEILISQGDGTTFTTLKGAVYYLGEDGVYRSKGYTSLYVRRPVK